VPVLQSKFLPVNFVSILGHYYFQLIHFIILSFFTISFLTFFEKHCLIHYFSFLLFSNLKLTTGEYLQIFMNFFFLAFSWKPLQFHSYISIIGHPINLLELIILLWFWIFEYLCLFHCFLVFTMFQFKASNYLIPQYFSLFWKNHFYFYLI
jgi:hypothetical protein